MSVLTGRILLISWNCCGSWLTVTARVTLVVMLISYKIRNGCLAVGPGFKRSMRCVPGVGGAGSPGYPWADSESLRSDWLFIFL